MSLGMFPSEVPLEALVERRALLLTSKISIRLSSTSKEGTHLQTLVDLGAADAEVACARASPPTRVVLVCFAVEVVLALEEDVVVPLPDFDADAASIWTCRPT